MHGPLCINAKASCQFFLQKSNCSPVSLSRLDRQHVNKRCSAYILRATAASVRQQYKHLVPARWGVYSPWSLKHTQAH
jgi:hypothetical protein